MRRPSSKSGSPPHSVTSDTGTVGTASKTCECPMCYHGVSNPCPECGCPSRSTTSSSLSLHTARQKTGGRAGDFVSPSSDYYSLSPGSPTSSQLPPSDPAWTGPLYAKIVKQKQPAAPAAPAAPGGDKKADDDDEQITKDHSHPGHSGPPSYQSSTGGRKKPVAPSFSSSDLQERTDSRRHSWAGSRRGGGGGAPVKQKTSLHDFKKLLAQQTPGQNPHRISAKELLEKTKSSPPGSQESQGLTKPGPVRKRSSPWVDKRFSVIQEEMEGQGSKENLIE